MADGLFSILFQVGINIRPAKHGGGWDGNGRVVEREEDKPSYRHFGVAVAIWGSYKAPTTLSRYSWRNGSSFRSWKCHSINRDITGLAKYPPEKQTSYNIGETVHE